MPDRPDPFARPRPTRRLACAWCKHSWSPRVREPRLCPNCHHDWRRPRVGDPNKRLKCAKCGHEWTPKVAHDPCRCPACYQAWKTPSRRARGKDAKLYRCRNCGHRWRQRLKGVVPKRCPACGVRRELGGEHEREREADGERGA